MSVREVIQGLQEIGEDESIQYTLTVSPAPAGGSTPAITILDEDGWENVTATAAPAGSAVVSGATIPLPLIQGSGLTRNHVYRVQVRYTDGLNTLEPYFRMECKR